MHTEAKGSTLIASSKPVTVRLDEEILALLDRAAREDRRSRAAMARLLLERGLQSLGYFVEPPKSQQAEGGE